ncbi:MAG TPA: hypothetical protein VKZ39_01750 [Sphaerochaetaceae bacterium]|jgi:hypothetical protein|nr:hypothetical protein [Sphaerochaetaceae bacterium]
MSEDDRGIVRSVHLSIKERVVAIGMIITIFAALAVPVSQAARNRELEVQMRYIATNMTQTEEQTRLVESRMAEARLPEITIRQSVLQGLSLEKIVFDQAKIVVVEE